jgi:hypothetical protein
VFVEKIQNQTSIVECSRPPILTNTSYKRYNANLKNSSLARKASAGAIKSASIEVKYFYFRIKLDSYVAQTEPTFFFNHQAKYSYG